MTRPKRKPRPCTAPMLVIQATNDIETHERMSVQAFKEGLANTDHFDNLADCHDLLNLAAADKNDPQVIAVCDLTGIALLNIKDNYDAFGNFVADADELRALELLADTSKDFWSRQSGAFFRDCFTELKKVRAVQKERRVAA
ncbi:hypothetical protein J5J83_19905 [Azoarcus sp. L1K30]|uniref:hypothetical protein n=1 Tax=Azoarcus sp. L1K30 TaxID=2820277 RepID=UPI001B839AC8|nr:hypothetical protein [Azoarcus sp. L1K30]MBR0568393.1 hypothetical protein [Azoarcus sp. L1K30]